MANDPKLVLNLLGAGTPALESTCFSTRGGKIVAVRGQTAGAFRGAFAFRLTAAVEAITAFFLIAKANSLAPGGSSGMGALAGEDGSLAASLDYALSKQPMWLLDMFGLDAAGTPTARRIVLRSNPERKRPGPVVLALNEHFLPAERIQIILNGREVTDAGTMRRLAVRCGADDTQTNTFVPSGRNEMSRTCISGPVP